MLLVASVARAAMAALYSDHTSVDQMPAAKTLTCQAQPGKLLTFAFVHQAAGEPQPWPTQELHMLACPDPLCSGALSSLRSHPDLPTVRWPRREELLASQAKGAQ